MKFNEYAIVSKELEKQGKSINELVEEYSDDFLNEYAKDIQYEEFLFEGQKRTELDTGGRPKWLSPKNWVRRKKITNNAYKYLDYAKEKILNKSLPGILKSFKEFASKAAAMEAEGKQPKEIAKMLKRESQNVIKMQEEAIDDLMNNRVSRIEQNVEKRIKEIIKNVSSTDTQTKLDNYWVSLASQVKQLLYKAIAKAKGQMIEETIRNNEELARMINLMGGAKNLNVKMEELKKKSAEEMKAANVGESEGEKTSGEETKEHKIESGQKYKIDGVLYTIVDVSDDGETIKAKGDKGTYTVKKGDGKFEKLTTENLEKEEEKEPETAEETV